MVDWLMSSALFLVTRPQDLPGKLRDTPVLENILKCTGTNSALHYSLFLPFSQLFTADRKLAKYSLEAWPLKSPKKSSVIILVSLA